MAPSVASLLIDGGAIVDKQDETGFAALHFAVINNNPDLVKLYLQHDAKINIIAFPYRYGCGGIMAAEKCGLSPLWFAVKYLPSGSHCEELLLALGAKVTDTDTCAAHCPLFAVGSKEGFKGVLRYIRSPGFDINHRCSFLGSHLINVIRAYCCYSSSEFQD